MILHRPYLGPLIVAAFFGVVASIFWPTVAFLIGVGREHNSSTPPELVVGVTLVLIWNLRHALAAIPVRPFLAGFIGLLGLGFFWLAGQLVVTRTFTQFAVLAMVPMAVLTLLGVRWLRAMALPFLVLVFALPVWGPLIPNLVRWSANFAEWAIRASGVPIYRDGAYFVLPSGSWSIADSCSGSAYLSACLLLGVLYAWTLYHSPRKRMLFIIGAAAIGVVGNWIRVYLTMMIAHFSDNRLLRDDHGPFGWWLFAALLGAFCWLGWRYRDTEPAPGTSGAAAAAGASETHVDKAGAVKLAAISLGIVAAMGVWPLVESRLSAPEDAVTNEIARISSTGGWVSVSQNSEPWMPTLQNPTQVRVQAFEKGGQRVEVFIGTFRRESWDAKLVTTSNGLAGRGARLTDRGSAPTALGGRPVEVKTGIILALAGRLLAWHWYWVDGVATGSDLRAKFQQLRARLTGVHPASAWVAISTAANTPSADSSGVLQTFMRDMGGSLETALTQTGKR